MQPFIALARLLPWPRHQGPSMALRGVLAVPSMDTALGVFWWGCALPDGSCSHRGRVCSAATATRGASGKPFVAAVFLRHVSVKYHALPQSSRHGGTAHGTAWSLLAGFTPFPLALGD